jgi:hypothetical protein
MYMSLWVITKQERKLEIPWSLFKICPMIVVDYVCVSRLEVEWRLRIILLIKKWMNEWMKINATLWIWLLNHNHHHMLWCDRCYMLCLHYLLFLFVFYFFNARHMLHHFLFFSYITKHFHFNSLFLESWILQHFYNL